MTLSPTPDLILKMQANLQPEKVPSLPDVPFDIALQVFTDVSLRVPGDSNRSDNEVLAIVGKSALESILTSILFHRMPPLNAEELKTARDEWMSEASLMTWMNYHKDIIRKVRCLPGTAQTPEILIRAWYAYLGAIQLTRGYPALDQFIRALVDPSLVDSVPPVSRHRSPPPGGQSATPSSSHKPDTHGQNVAFLNQSAAQKGCKVEYEYDSTGQPHALAWTAHILVDGKWVGTATALSKKAANEQAAKEALAKLGWI